MSSSVDSSVLESSQDAVARLAGAVDDDMPVKFSATDYYPPKRPTRPYNGIDISVEPPSRRASSDDDDEPSDDDDDARVELSKTPKTLEDLYTMFPKIGDGMHYVRVERLAPTSWREDGQDYRCGGWIADLFEPIPFHEFVDRYGGQKYRATMMGPPRPSDVKMDSRGNPLHRTLKSVTIDISGPPKFNTKDRSRSEDADGKGGQMSMGVAEVEKMRIEAEMRRVEREAEERRLAQLEAKEAHKFANEAALRGPEKYLDLIQRTTGASVAELKQQSQNTIDLLKTQIDDLRGQNQTLRSESDRLRADIVNRQTEFERKVRDAENERTNQLKGEHERELRRVAEESAKALEKMSSTNRDEISRLTSQHALELQRVETAAQKEREMISRDAERRESQLSKDFDRERVSTRETYEARISQLKDTYDARIRDMQMTFERELRTVTESKEREVLSLKESRDREVQAVRAQFEMQSNVSKETATIRVETAAQENQRLRDEIARLQARSDALQSQVTALQAAQHKEPEEAIENALKLASLVGYGPKEEAAAAPTGEEEAADWKKTLARAGLGLVDKLPELAQTVLSSRGQAAEQQAQQQAMMQQQAAMRQQQARQVQEQRRRQQQRMLQQAQQQGMPPSLGPSPMQQQPMQAPMPGQMAQPGPVPMQGQPRPVPQRAVRFPSQQRAPWVEGQDQVAAPQPMPSQPASPPQAQVSSDAASIFEAPAEAMTQPVETAEAEEKATISLEDIPQELMAEFFMELDKAIREGVVPAGMWASMFSQKVGPEMAKTLVEAIPVEQVIEIAKTNPSSVIVTRDGQAYVKSVWEKVATS